MDSVSHYDVLGIDVRATADDIRSAYRRAAQQCHPDRFADDPTAEGRFKRLTIAYKTLRHPAMRQSYDAELGISSNWQPWYGPRDQSWGEDNPQMKRMVLEGFERVAIVLASGGFSAPRIAAKLAMTGCSYRTAWALAWQARHQVLRDELDRLVMFGDTDGTTQDRQPGRSARVDGVASVGSPAGLAPYEPGAPSASRALALRPTRALVTVRQSWQSRRPQRLKRLLWRIAQFLGFSPPRMSRENRKLLRLEYRDGAPRGR